MRVPFRKLWIAAIPGSLLILGISDPCSDKGYLFFSALISALFLSAWTTQYSIKAGERSSKWYEYPFSVLYDFCFLLLLSFVCTIFTPAYQCYTGRAKASEAIASIDPLRMEISDNLLAGKEIQPQELEHPSNLANVAYLEVGKDGQILILTGEPVAGIRLIPKRKEKDITWRCHGRPEKLVPAECR